MAFEYAGYRVSCAASVGEALGVLRKGSVDVVLSDYCLGDGGAVDLLEGAAAERLLEGTAVLICTSNSQVELPRGIPVVYKPVGYEQLLEAVERQLPRSGS